MEQYRGTTICSVRRGNKVVMGGDGQVTLGNTVMKSNARKVRRMHKDQVIAGFAGATADAFTFLNDLRASLKSTPATWFVPQWKWRKTGVLTGC